MGSLLGIWSFPVFAALLGGVARPYLALSIGTALLVTVRHRANLARLLPRRREARVAIRDPQSLFADPRASALRRAQLA